MLSNFESLDGGNNQKTWRLVAILASIQWSRGRGKKERFFFKKWNYSDVASKNRTLCFLRSLDLGKC